MNRVLAAALMLTLTPMFAAADGGAGKNDLTRDEITAVKRKLQAVVVALGAPAGFEKAREDFRLPTGFSPAGDTKTYYPISAGVDLTFDGGQTRLNQNAQTQSVELQKKMSAAMAAGDYEALAKIQQDMVTQMNAQQATAVEAGAKGEIRVTASFNRSGGGGIDPDNVVLEKPGVLAVKDPSSSAPNSGKVTVYFDPVALAKTGTVSNIGLRGDPTAKRVAVLNAMIEASGPLPTLEAWVKKIDTAGVLAQIDR